MRDKQSIKDDIIQQLSTVIDPELRVDIVNLGLVYSIDLDNDGICLIEMTLTTMGCPLTNVLADMVTKAVKKVPEVRNVDVEFVWEPAWTTERMSRLAKLTLGIH
ncbi:metal-sulfur cluster assembly factor [Limosilactobacillus sp. STM2_1]|uniref:Metal-sulfur cluster assembly factor n=1 Tax=Limosilactobacillus rudii TaxID=2759755 RepID=A0A7W3YLQ7_9LACO|nr:metal-sulfur cluster assembly factor [Limosilactobacillus rudii]MBB1080144.1 metal-sulfur cluster assembly factor [Limosilactobacillus rudii]MBB1096659.1 metal-sulfur cluster assembly factor [Limosilactobacillus rudii]MCD7133631.1 metal-sulfur cluster assembly factor [Limosilactobacillus rudii]